MNNSEKKKSNKIIVFEYQNDSRLSNDSRGDIINGSYLSRISLVGKLQDLRVDARDIRDFNEFKKIKKQIAEYQSILDTYDK